MVKSFVFTAILLQFNFIKSFLPKYLKIANVGLALVHTDMSITIPESDEVAPCTYCLQLRRIFILIAMSAVLPMIFFTALLLTVAFGNVNTPVNPSTPWVIEFVFVILYMQLTIAISVLIVSFVKRKSPLVKYHVWYLCFHIMIMLLFICASMVLTVINNIHWLGLIVFFCGLGYFYAIYRYLKLDSSTWKILRRTH